MPEQITPEMRERILERAKNLPFAQWTPTDEQDDHGEELGRCSKCGGKTLCGNFCGSCGATFLSQDEISRGQLKEDEEE